MTRKRFSKKTYDNAIKCKLCGSNNKINVHHKDGDSSNNKDDNAIALCNSCHKSTHKWQRKQPYVLSEAKESHIRERLLKKYGLRYFAVLSSILMIRDSDRRLERINELLEDDIKW